MVSLRKDIERGTNNFLLRHLQLLAFNLLFTGAERNLPLAQTIDTLMTAMRTDKVKDNSQ
jgi:hypothetical protein